MDKQMLRHDLDQDLSAMCVADVPEILEEITVEEMAVDGICGIY